jgi:hypothetical protein
MIAVRSSQDELGRYMDGSTVRRIEIKTDLFFFKQVNPIRDFAWNSEILICSMEELSK